MSIVGRSATLCVLAALLQSSCLQDSYWVKLSNPLAIDNNWVALRPSPPLRAEKDRQFIVLDLEPPFKADFLNEGKGPEAGGILTPEGEVINPEIEIIDQGGATHVLTWRGSVNGMPKYSLPYPAEFPRDRTYETVRIRSPKNIKSKAIYWFCDSAKDWH